LEESGASDVEWKREEELWQARNETEGDGIGAGLDSLATRSEALGDTTRNESSG